MTDTWDGNCPECGACKIECMDVETIENGTLDYYVCSECDCAWEIKYQFSELKIVNSTRRSQ